MDIRALLLQFALEEEVETVLAPRELLDGHINKTFVLTVKTRSGAQRRYLLQKINTFVFRNPAQLMENIRQVTQYLRAAQSAGQTQGQQTLTVYPTRGGACYYEDANGDCWRCYNFVENTFSLQSAQSAQDAYRAAKAFGAFQRLMDGFPIARLHETIPDFHHSAKRYDALETAVAADSAGRRRLAEAEIAFARKRRADASRLLPLAGQSGLPLRVTHNDTKLNNVLFDCESREPVCVVDLDTVMPG
ncbi:MAG: aminoglycoside phosphotransferase family protein, partial [Oscillospiraceae bacterium]|nr:aminoglycoside phosphotransferase family protein [Oscillospiraceae bacterium]